MKSAPLAVWMMAGAAGLLPAVSIARERENPSAQIVLNSGQSGCLVDLDSVPVGRTDLKGVLAIDDVDPSDHYLHVRCPDQQQETPYYVSLGPGQVLQLRHEPGATASADPARSPLEAAENKLRLRRDVQQAVHLRAFGRLEEAVRLLHEAARMDPENSDLHRELGITFLLSKEWKRARVEMLQALRHDPSDADAHNGLGYALEKLDDLDAALKEYRTATQLEPDNTSYRQHYLEAIGKIAQKQSEKKK